MKLAAVLDVGHGTAALKYAIGAQMLLLERLGSKLDSIRLAAPRLHRHACTSAIAENPDVLVAVGGPRAARRAGQLAYLHHLPIVFLPGFRASGGLRHLWGCLSLEDMVAAIARGDLEPCRLGVGTAGDQVFFEQASCGLLAHLPELRRAFVESDTFDEGWNILMRALHLARHLLGPNIRFGSANDNFRRASALLLNTAQPNAQIDSGSEAPRPALKCSAIRYGALDLIVGLVSGKRDGNWLSHTEDFECADLIVEAGQSGWVLLDGEPVRFKGPIPFGFVPKSLQTFVFSTARLYANDNRKDQDAGFRRFSAALKLD